MATRYYKVYVKYIYLTWSPHIHKFRVPAHKWKFIFFLALVQNNWMQPILVPCEAPFISNLEKKHYWSSGGCIQFLSAGAKKYKFSFLLCAGPLSSCSGVSLKKNVWFIDKQDIRCDWAVYKAQFKCRLRPPIQFL